MSDLRGGLYHFHLTLPPLPNYPRGSKCLDIRKGFYIQIDSLVLVLMDHQMHEVARHLHIIFSLFPILPYYFSAK